MLKSTRWSYEERVKLKELYNIIPIEELCIKLGRSQKSIVNQVYYLRKRGWKFNRVTDS
jgi:hypothetical protein